MEATATTPSYTVYTATATYKPNGYTYTFTDEQTVVNYTTVELGEEDNTETLETSNGLEAKAALTGRTLYQNGKWNTLCLPSDLVFTGVTLTKDLRDDEITVDDKGSATVTFVGTYKKLSYSADDKSILFLGENNTLYYPKSGATIGAQRGYFKLSGITAGEKADGARTIVLDLGDEDNVTGIIEAEANSSLFTLHSSLKEAWYTLDGLRLSGKPAQKGIYINNGKKVVIK